MVVLVLNLDECLLSAGQIMLGNQHFYIDDKKQKVELTDLGRHLIRYSNPPVGPHSHAMDKLHEHVERALQAHYRFRRDQHYMVLDDKIDVGWDCLGVQKGNYALRDVLNITLFKLQSSGFVDEAWRKAFGSDPLMKVPAQPYF